jgi:replicative DNA helicase
LRDWGGKYVGAIARLAGILHLAEHGVSGINEPVTAVTVRSAYKVGEYFKACAIKAFADMGTDQVTADAVYLLGRIKRLGVDEVSERDMIHTAKRIRTKAELKPALDLLVDHGYLIPVPQPRQTGRGRPATPRFKVHP